MSLLKAALPDLEVGPCAPAEALWLESGGDAPPFRLRSVEGAACLWHSERPQAIAADLDKAEPLLKRIEAASGWRFEPRSAAPARPATVVAIGETGTIVELAVGTTPPPATLMAVASAASPDPLLALPRRLRATGPALSVEEIAGLAAGDLLLLPPVLPVSVDGVDGLSATLEVATGRLASSRWDGTGEGRFALPVELTLPPVMLNGAELQAVAGGGEVVVGALCGAGAAELSVAGRRIGTGRLVRIGQAIALQVEDKVTEEEQRG